MMWRKCGITVLLLLCWNSTDVLGTVTDTLMHTSDAALSEWTLALDEASASFSPDETAGLQWIASRLQEAGIPQMLKYLPLCIPSSVEEDVSRTGLWHLSPWVALRYGLVVSADHDERLVPQAATRAAISYLHDLYKLYGDWWKTIHAFVYSPSAVRAAEIRRSALAVSRIPSCAVLSDVISRTNGVADRPLDHPVMLSVLAEKTGCPADTLRHLNPLYRGDVWRPVSGYGLRLPESAALLFDSESSAWYQQSSAQISAQEEALRKAQAAAEKKKQEPEYYVVKRGDTLSKIAQRYHVRVIDLRTWNNLKSDLIRDGQRLRILRNR